MSQWGRLVLRVLKRGRRYAALLNGLEAPVLLVHGERDRLVPVAAARTLAAENPEWTVEIVPDLGHAPMLENPELVAGIIADWLDPPAPNRPPPTGR